MASNVEPFPLVQRYEAGQPLAQDVLSQIEAFACGVYSQATAPITYNRAWYDARAFRHPEQLNALACGYALNFPYSHPERVRYFDNVRHASIDLSPVPQGEITIELCRVPVQRWSVGVLERIATYARGTVLANGVSEPDEFPVIFGGPLGQQIEVAGAEVSEITGVSDPCPFPRAPQFGGFIPGISIRFHLIHYVISREVLDDPPMFVGQERDVPPSPIIAPWSDMRYQWGSRYSGGLKWLVGGHGFIRLFATVRVFGTAQGSGWRVDFCSRLAGYTQEAGPAAAARRAALWRV